MSKITDVASCLACLMLAACTQREPAEQREATQVEADEDRGLARITQAAAREVGIEVREAGPAIIRDVLPLYGVVQPDAELVRRVSARFPGLVRTVRKAAGETVKKGDVLATVESNDSLQTYPITAPINGVLTERSVNPGEAVGDQTIFVVTDLSTVWVELSLSAGDRARVRVGQTVRVTAVQGESSAAGHVIWVSPLGTIENQSISARVLLDNTDRIWSPGLYVTGEIVVGEAEAAVTVASSALQSVDGRPVVFVEVPKGFEARSVKPGRSGGDLTEILEGLASGERYAAANSFVIKAEIEKAGVEEDD